MKTELQSWGYTFKGETDTEVIAFLIEELLKDGSDFRTAFLGALKLLEGTYGIVALHAGEPGVLYVARHGSPMVIGCRDEVREIAAEYKDSPNFLYIGRLYEYPVALEGALKLKEISYIHAEGVPAAELKHGPIALVDPKMPTVALAAQAGVFAKMMSNVQEIRARGGRILAVVREGDSEMRQHAEHTITIPPTVDPLVPILAVIPLQFLAYHIAVMRGCDVDRPRNLAKSVTVE